jgi:hypothetical protein
MNEMLKYPFWYLIVNLTGTHEDVAIGTLSAAMKGRSYAGMEDSDQPIY